MGCRDERAVWWSPQGDRRPASGDGGRAFALRARKNIAQSHPGPFGIADCAAFSLNARRLWFVKGAAVAAALYHDGDADCLELFRIVEAAA